MDDQVRLEGVSAALDAEGPEPFELTPGELRFRDHALSLRRALRVADADLRPPDLSTDILDHIGGDTRTRPAPALAAAAVFVLAGLVALLALRPGGPAEPTPAAAEMGERVIEAQRALDAFDATVELLERGVHPEVVERRLVGTLRYRAPEQLWLELREPDPVTGWPANDLDLVLDDGTTWRSGLAGCPVGAQPGCLHPRTHATTGLAPFSDGAMSPLDLVMPVHAFLPDIETEAAHRGDRIVIDTTVGRIDQLIRGLTAAGAIRGLHPTDPARVELDSSSLTLRQLSVTAADNLARANWAATHGYADRPGVTILELGLEPADLGPLAALPAPPQDAATIDAGFVPARLAVDWRLPEGFAVHRTGEIDAGGPRTAVVSLSAGRAWIRVDRTDEWDRPGLFGGLGPLVREVAVGQGVGYLDLGGTRLALHTPDHDLVLTGSVSTELLIEVAAGLEVGMPVDPRSMLREPEVPRGVLVPSGEHLIAASGDAIIVGVPGPGRTGTTITHRPASDPQLPSGNDLVETSVRGRPARYDPGAGTISWIEGGWWIEMRCDALDLAGLKVAADGLAAR